MILALLCGLFYGALFHSAWVQSAQRHRLDRMLAGIEKAIEEMDSVDGWESCDCSCSEHVEKALKQCDCCSTDEKLPHNLMPANAYEFYQFTHTGTEDG